MVIMNGFSNKGALKEFERLYDSNDFAGIMKYSNGLRFLKLRSFNRKPLMQDFIDMYKIRIEHSANAREMYETLFETDINEEKIDEFIRITYNKLRAKRKENEDRLYRELYKLKVLDWGGFRGNNVERTLVDNYIKKIWSYDELIEKIEKEINPKIQGYVTSSWYNNWSSILIEDMFKDHKDVLPTLGLIKKIDFFWQDVPFDLKVTYFPDGFMHEIRREKGLIPELTALKQIARTIGIPIDNDRDEELKDYLMASVSESIDSRAKKFMESLRKERNAIVDEAIIDPKKLIKWLYENQGERRFDAANRFFLVLVDKEKLEESWKLKRNKDLLKPRITQFLDSYHGKSKGEQISFEWKGKTYTTISQILFITK